jgi:hypothetical protein
MGLGAVADARCLTLAPSWGSGDEDRAPAALVAVPDAGDPVQWDPPGSRRPSPLIHFVFPAVLWPSLPGYVMLSR